MRYPGGSEFELYKLDSDLYSYDSELPSVDFGLFIAF